MKKTIYNIAFFISFCFLSTNLYAYTPNTDVNFEETQEVQELLEALLKHQNANVEWQTAAETLHQHARQINNSKFQKAKFKKQLKLVNSYLHKHVLQEYDAYAQLSQTLNDGTYNCVTSTTLASLILSDLGIDHEMILETAHVYLIAYKDGRPYRLETTNTKNTAVKSMDLQTQHEFVNYMLRQNIISRSEYDTKSSDELFDHYFGQLVHTINFENLIAVHYYNDAIDAITKKDYAKALPAIEKAYQLFENKLYKGLLLVCLNQLSEEINPLVAESYLPLLKLAQYDGSPMVLKELEQYVQLGAENWLIRNTDEQQFEAFTQTLLELMEEGSVKQSVQSIAFKTEAKAYTLIQDYGKATESLDRAIHLYPEDLELKGLLLRIIEEQLRRSRKYEQMDAIVKQYEKRYPFLYKNNMIKDTKIYIETCKAVVAYKNDELDMASNFLNKALKMNAELSKDAQDFSKSYFVDVYLAASSAAVRVNDYQMAKNWLDRVLKLDAKNISARRKLDLLQTSVTISSK